MLRNPSKVLTIAGGLSMTVAVLIAQFILPFAFDFLSTFAIFGVGIWTGMHLTRD